LGVQRYSAGRCRPQRPEFLGSALRRTQADI